MGAYHSCVVDTSRTCPSILQEPMTCNADLWRGGFDGEISRLGERQYCWVMTDRVVLYIVLPILLFLTALITFPMFLKWQKLRAMRESRQQQQHLHQQQQSDFRFELLHGRYASGCADWIFHRDLLPYLVPDLMKTFCIVNPAPIRAMLATALISFLILIPLFLSLGFKTRNRDSTQGEFNPNPFGLTTAGFTLIPLSIVLCVVLCVTRSCCSRWKRDRLKKMEELNRAELGLSSSSSDPAYAVDVEAIPMVPLGQNHAFEQSSSTPPRQQHEEHEYSTSSATGGHEIGVAIQQSEESTASAPDYAPSSQHSTNYAPLA